MLVFIRSYTVINFPVKRDFASKPLSHFPRTYHSIMSAGFTSCPVFQHSLAQTGFSRGTGYYSDVAPGRANCERSELSFMGGRWATLFGSYAY